MIKDFLSIHDLSAYEYSKLMDLTQDVKKNPRKYRTKLQDKILAMIFEKPSLRTRVTFEAGMVQLGGEAIYLSPTDIQLGKRESTHDIGKNLERWVDGIMIRTFAHRNVIDLAAVTRIPVINALSDLSHPCQGMADFFTLREKKRDLEKLAYVGDGNNVCHSLMFAAARAGITMAVAVPKGYEPSPEIIRLAQEDGRETGYSFELTHDPYASVRGADAVYTDVWASMGQESEKDKRAKIFAPFQVNKALMAEAKPGAFFMHCLPAHRGDEVTDEVMDSPQSIVFEQAENRLHIQKAIMLSLMAQQK